MSVANTAHTEREQARSARFMLLSRGAAAVLLGLFALSLPSRTLRALVFGLGLYLLCDGALTTYEGVRRTVHSARAFWPYLLEGALSMATGLFALLRPSMFAVGVLIVVALRSMGTGVAEIAAGRRLHADTGAAEWPAWIAGLASLLFGLALITLPRVGVVTLIWLSGAYALVFGGALVSSAFRLGSAPNLRSPTA